MYVDFMCCSAKTIWSDSTRYVRVVLSLLEVINVAGPSYRMVNSWVSQS